VALRGRVILALTLKILQRSILAVRRDAEFWNGEKAPKLHHSNENEGEE
jgi:hypothetical protein